MKTEYLLDIILKIAYDMLVSGSEVGRVEQQIDRMCRAYGMEEVEVFIITSSILVSVKDKKGNLFTQTKRIRKYRTDFYRIQLLEQLIKEIEMYKLSVKQIETRRQDIENCVEKERVGYGTFSKYILFSGISMVFTLFFGGNILDGIISFFCGCCIQYVIQSLEKAVTNRFAVNLLGSVMGAFCAAFIYKIGIPVSIDKVNIGNIMLLIPGLATVNAFKDLVSGETITGLLRLADAFIQALAVAFGFALVILVLGV